jgi:Lipocalin-like domain
MRLDRRSPAVLLACLALTLALALALRAQSDPRTHLEREDLLGTWRLTHMSYSGLNGTHVDPFYQPDSSGVLIYDRSGWMSVQISGPRRASADIPSVRGQRVGAAIALREASAFDTYYAYFGTWTFDPATGTVTHHVAGALIPAEVGLEYGQSAALDHGRLVLTTHSVEQGQTIVREKIWERVRAAP